MEQSELKTSVRAAKHGSAQAFGRLYEHYAAELYRFALWYLHNTSDAEDAVQEAILSAWRNIRALRKEEAFKAWLFQILANACKNQLQMKSSLRLVSLEENGASARIAYVPAFEDDAVGSLLGSLSPEDRAIVTMAVLGDFKSGEIASVLGMKSATVRSRLSRALHALREELESEAPALAAEEKEKKEEGALQ